MWNGNETNAVWNGANSSMGVRLVMNASWTGLICWNGNGTDLGVDVFQTLHSLSEQSPDAIGSRVELSGVNQLSQCLLLTVLHLYIHVYQPILMTGAILIISNN